MFCSGLICLSWELCCCVSICVCWGYCDVEQWVECSVVDCFGVSEVVFAGGVVDGCATVKY